MNEFKYVDPKADLTFKKVFGEHCGGNNLFVDQQKTTTETKR